MNTWNKLFDILQVLNPQSYLYTNVINISSEVDKDIIKEDEKRWDDICHYMDILKEDRVDADEGISSMIRLLRDIYDGNTDTPKNDIRNELIKYGIDLKLNNDEYQNDDIVLYDGKYAVSRKLPKREE
jgi:hypothetical protein|tara:strand:- start:366 stop:749 length:384 start_codon:yes stop_codon:yes gene_type:complete